MQTWTYRFEVFDGSVEDAVVWLNAFGTRGWECFSVESYKMGNAAYQLHCWLKRGGPPTDPGQAELT
jgi:hypothetical protein